MIKPGSAREIRAFIAKKVALIAKKVALIAIKW
jgi:hypothetical protein